MPPHLSSSPSQNDDPKLTHLTPTSTAQMIHLPPSKPSTSRLATATSTLTFSNPLPLHLIRQNSLKKGDVLAVARIAGIMAAKRTSEVVPLCHNVALAGVGVEVGLVGPGGGEVGEKQAGGKDGEEQAGGKDEEKQTGGKDGEKQTGEHGSIHISATVRTNAQTGVEMEALMAVSAAGLTVYDMCKGVDRGIVISNTRVVRKEGGASGSWVEGQKVGERYGDGKSQSKGESEQNGQKT
ncbi:MAG: hypothetical protein M1828_001324 [Chrysothrix sp. TS-e1954]|nr:MAG: hypothetical protein M1828_001324 [Chrysothrix sp. TS-e1954]